MMMQSTISETEMKRRAKISAAMKGRSQSEEHRAKLSLVRKGRVLSAEHRKKIGEAQKGKKVSEETRRRMSEASKGQVPSPKAIAATVTRMTGLKMSPQQRRAKSAASPRGNLHHAWKGGATAANAAIRQSLEARIWRDAVFSRDDFTCRKCKKRGGELNAHHIKGFAEAPDLRFEVSNGVTLCEPCHRAVHKRKAVV